MTLRQGPTEAPLIICPKSWHPQSKIVFPWQNVRQTPLTSSLDPTHFFPSFLDALLFKKTYPVASTKQLVLPNGSEPKLKSSVVFVLSLGDVSETLPHYLHCPASGSGARVCAIWAGALLLTCDESGSNQGRFLSCVFCSDMLHELCFFSEGLDIMIQG